LELCIYLAILVYALLSHGIRVKSNRHVVSAFVFYQVPSWVGGALGSAARVPGTDVRYTQSAPFLSVKTTTTTTTTKPLYAH
jgi:hypothetical protein